MKMDKLIEGHNWVYLTHVVLVAPLLILIPLAYIYKDKLNWKMVSGIVLAIIGVAITVIYNPNKPIVSKKQLN